MLKLGIALALYATAACVGLAFVYEGTKKIIEVRAEEDLNNALKDLFPAANSFEKITGTISNSDSVISFGSEYVAQKDNEVIGVGIEASGPSYGGPIKVLVGVGIDGKITRVKILEHSDTPGLGANAKSPSYFVDKAKGITFYGQFAGKSVQDPFIAKQDVKAITASTITSQAVAKVVKVAGETASGWLATQTGGAK